jgi:DNA-binding transcriptional MerR regulator
MIDTLAFERLNCALDRAVRDYTKADADIQRTKNEAIDKVREVGTDGIEVKEILDKMSAVMDDCNLTKKIALEQFEETKQKLIRLVENLKMPRSYF